MQTVFNDPQGWAQIMLGTQKRYRILQAQFVVFAFVTIVNALVMARTNDGFQWWGSFIVMVLTIAVGMIMLPFSLLRALRSFMPYEQNGRGFEVRFPDRPENFG